MGVSGNSVAGKSFQIFTVSEELLQKVVEAVQAGEKEARSSGNIQSFEVFCHGFRQNISLGRIMVVPAKVCNDRKDFPTALLHGALVRVFGTGGEEISDLIEKRIGESEFDEYSQADFDTLKKELFVDPRTGEEASLIVFAPNWMNSREYVTFHYTKDEVQLKNNLRHQVFAAYYNPAVSSAFNALMTNVNTTKVDVTDVTPKLTYPFLSENPLKQYPQLDKQAAYKKATVLLNRKTADEVTKQTLEPQELDVFEALDTALENSLLPAASGAQGEGGFKAPEAKPGVPREASAKTAHVDANGICPGCKKAGESCSCTNCTCKEASLKKVAYVAHVPGHKNSKGEAAPWVIKQHETGKILSSHKTKGEAESHLRDMEAHKHGAQYSGDPRWLTAKYPAKCAKCGRGIKAGEQVYYYPQGKHTYCDAEDCGKAAARDFESHAFDESMHAGSVKMGEEKEVDLGDKGSFKVEKGGLHKALGIPEDQTIPMSKLHAVMNGDYPEHVKNMARSAIGLKSMDKAACAPHETPFTNVGPGTEAADAQEDMVKAVKETFEIAKEDELTGSPIGIAIDETGVPRSKAEEKKSAKYASKAASEANNPSNRKHDTSHPETQRVDPTRLSSAYSAAYNGGFVDKYDMPPKKVRDYMNEHMGNNAEYAPHAVGDHQKQIEAGAFGEDPLNRKSNEKWGAVDIKTVKRGNKEIMADHVAELVAAEFDEPSEAISSKSAATRAKKEKKLASMRPKQAVGLDIDSIWDSITEDMGPAPLVDIDVDSNSNTEDREAPKGRPNKRDVQDLPEEFRSDEPEEEKQISDSEAESQETDLENKESAWNVDSKFADFVQEVADEVEDEEVPEGYNRVSCDQCQMLSINGVPCHEHGCPNMGARWDAENQDWVQQRECRECGMTVDADDPCCSAPMEDFEDEEIITSNNDNMDMDMLASMDIKTAADAIKYAGMDLNQAINVFTRTMLMRLNEGAEIEDEEVEALNALREQAGMKLIKVPSGAGKQEAPKQHRQDPPSGGWSGSKKKPTPVADEDFHPQALVINGARISGQPLGDNAQWTNRFDIKSESSDNLYRIAQNKNRRYWACSCPGWIGHRKCKHLRALGLPPYEQPFEAQLKQASVKKADTADNGYDIDKAPNPTNKELGKSDTVECHEGYDKQQSKGAAKKKADTRDNPYNMRDGQGAPADAKNTSVADTTGPTPVNTKQAAPKDARRCSNCGKMVPPGHSCPMGEGKVTPKKADDVSKDFSEAKAETVSPDTVDKDIEQPTVGVEDAAYKNAAEKVALHFMNQYDIEDCAQVLGNDPVLGKYARFLKEFMEEVNSHSDGWAYWRAPVAAANQLMTLLEAGMAKRRGYGKQPEQEITEQMLRKAMGPIKAFMTRRGAEAGMQMPKLAADISGDMAEAKAETVSPDTVDSTIQQDTKSVSEAAKVAHPGKGNCEECGEFRELDKNGLCSNCRMEAKSASERTDGVPEVSVPSSENAKQPKSDLTGAAPEAHDVPPQVDPNKAAAAGDEYPESAEFDFGAGDLADIVLTEDTDDSAE